LQFTAKNGKAPQIIFLENHGVFVAADTVAEINDLYFTIMEKINQNIGEELPDDESKPFESPIIEKIKDLNPGFKTYVAKGTESHLIHHFSKDCDSFSKANTAFTPDDIVYCKAHYLYLPACADAKDQLAAAETGIAGYLSTYGYLPKVLVVEGQGVIAVEDSLKSVLNVLEVYTNILKISFLSENFGGPKFMTKAQIEFIDNWEVENYRRKMAKS